MKILFHTVHEQDRRQRLKSGMAIKRRRRFTSAEVMSGGKAREEGYPLLPPRKF